MEVENKDEYIAFLNAAIDRDMRARKIRTYIELAKTWRVTTKTIREWRSGEWTIADTALIVSLVDHCRAEHHAEQVAP